jgi:hypothetical protein
MAKPTIKVAQAVPKNILINVYVDDDGIVQLERAVDGAKAVVADFETELTKLDQRQSQLNQRFGITAQRIEDNARNLVKLAKTSAISRDQHDLVIKRLAVLDKQYEELTGSSLGFIRAIGQQSSNVGLAGATLTEFGRTISDANYGIRGIANNLSQLSSLFITLVSKQKEATTGVDKVKGAFGQLGREIMGPAGIIIAFQLIITLIEGISAKADEAKESLEDFSLDTATALLNLEKVAKQVRDNTGQINDDIIKSVKELGVLDDDVIKKYEDKLISEEELSGLISNKLKLIKAESELNESDKTTLENINKLREDELAHLELRAEKIRENTNRNFADEAQLNSISQRYLEKIMQREGIEDELEARRFIRNAQEAKAQELDEQILAVKQKINKVLESRNPLLSEILQLQREIEAVEGKKIENNTKLNKLEKERKKLEEQRAAFMQSIVDKLNKSEDKLLEQRLEREKQNQLKTFDELFKGEEDYQEKRAFLIQAYDLMIYKAKEERHAKHLKEVQKQNEKAEEDRLKLIKSNAKKALKAGREELKEQEKLELDNLKKLTDNIGQIMNQFTSLLDEFNSMGQSRFQRQVALINRERDEINASTSMTEEEKKSSLDRLDAKENELQVKRIKAERDLFTVKKIIGLAEFVNTQMMEANMFAVKQKFKIQDHILTQKLAVQQLVLMGQLSAQQGALLMSQMGANAAKGVGDTLASQGGFLAQLGPAGIPLMALTIATTIASIIAARKKAKAEIASLTKASSSAGGSSSSAPAVAQLPSFNIVGASPVNQLASAIASKEQAPLKAQVVLSEVNSAQELERSTVSSSGI